MKIDMKKIALVIAAGIFVFSAAFGINGEDGKGAILSKFDNIHIFNYMTGAALQLQVNNGKIEGIKTKEIPLKDTSTPIKNLNFSLKREGLILGDERLDLDRLDEQQVLNGLKKMLDKARQQDKNLKFSVSVKPEGKTLRITFVGDARIGIPESE